MQRAVTRFYRGIKGLVGWGECEHYDSPLPGYAWYTTTTHNPNPNPDGFPNPGVARSAADVPEGAVDLAIRHHRYCWRCHGIEEFPAGQSMVCATWCRAALTRRDMEARRDAGSRTFIVEVELRRPLSAEATATSETRPARNVVEASARRESLRCDVSVPGSLWFRKRVRTSLGTALYHFLSGFTHVAWRADTGFV